jgi:hypothetical protein
MLRSSLHQRLRSVAAFNAACAEIANAFGTTTQLSSLRVRNSLTASFDPAAALNHPYQQENKKKQNVSKEQDYEDLFANDCRPGIELYG